MRTTAPGPQRGIEQVGRMVRRDPADDHAVEQGELHSTLWGFQNTQYRELINTSERALEKLAVAASTGRVA